MSNRLAHETSPYLQQHAGNPVDWYPWGEEALNRARDEDKPILLSVGYSACHWCHVMAHESFEDADVAVVMNRLFVNVKVDREERPDIDQIYQSAHQLLTRRAGGWPLTMFLTPDQRPFFCGTYFPKAPSYNLPGFADLCEHVARVYREQRQAIDAQNDELMTLLATTEAAGGGAEDPGSATIDAALRELKRLFDREHGGLGGAPKFPHPAELELTLREAILRGDEELKHLALLTLREMARGGVYDQLGGGFARYSVDATWTIPHFEKMLYDNGPLLRLCADAWQLSGEARFKSACEETAGWIMREMQSPEGGYYSSLDADSEHEEGKFYVWSREEVRDALEADEFALAARVYGLDSAPNFEGRHWHLRICREIEDVARELGMAPGTAEQVLRSARAKLFAVREQRVRPGRDEKILTSWNALAIHGMAHAARVFDRRDWLDSARRAAAFVRGTMWADSALRATFKDGKAHLNAYLDDHAFLLAALLEMLQADFRVEELSFATALADALLSRFEDAEAGGFFFTSHDHERLILRPKSAHDNATPSGNGVAAIALQRLGHLTGQLRYVHAAERVLRAFRAQVMAQPSAFASLLVALGESLNPPAVIILRGPAVDTGRWIRALRAAEDPARIVLAVEPGVPGLPSALDKPWTGGVNAWVCRGVSCLAPVSEVSGLLALLRG